MQSGFAGIWPRLAVSPTFHSRLAAVSWEWFLSRCPWAICYLDSNRYRQASCQPLSRASLLIDLGTHWSPTRYQKSAQPKCGLASLPPLFHRLNYMLSVSLAAFLLCFVRRRVRSLSRSLCLSFCRRRLLKSLFLWMRPLCLEGFPNVLVIRHSSYCTNSNCQRSCDGLIGQSQLIVWGWALTASAFALAPWSRGTMGVWGLEKLWYGYQDYTLKASKSSPLFHLRHLEVI